MNTTIATTTTTTTNTVVVRDSSFVGRNGGNPELRRIIDVGGDPHRNGVGMGRWYAGDWTQVLPSDGWTQEELDAVPLFEGY